MTTGDSRLRDYRPIVLIAFAAALVVNGLAIGWVYWMASQRSVVILSDLKVSEDNSLCPGDTLTYDFTIYVSSGSAVDLYTSEIRLATNEHVSDTRLQHFEFKDMTHIKITRNWVLPPVYADPISGYSVAWSPGEYIQRVSAGIVGRSELKTIDVPFVVNPYCAVLGH